MARYRALIAYPRVISARGGGERRALSGARERRAERLRQASGRRRVADGSVSLSAEPFRPRPWPSVII